jgi:putative transposase
MALRAGISSRGVPRRLYLDNGSPFISAQLERACAKLGIRLVHSRPGQPEGRGKIERFFRTVRDHFEIEAALADIADLGELNRLFGAWVEQIYHRREHSETSEAPLDRFMTPGLPALPAEAELHEAFLWSERRTVTKTATVSLHGNHYEVDAGLSRAQRPPLLRRRHQPHPPNQPRPTPRRQQPRRPIPHRRLRHQQEHRRRNLSPHRHHRSDKRMITTPTRRPRAGPNHPHRT